MFTPAFLSLKVHTGLVAFMLGFALGLVTCATGRSAPKREVELDLNSPLVVEAWNTACALAGVHEPWEPHGSVVRVFSAHPELLGEYIWYNEVCSDGSVHVHEQTVVWVDEGEPELLERNILVHEFLHQLKERLSLNDPVLASVPTEQYVCSLGACPDDPRTTVVGGFLHKTRF